MTEKPQRRARRQVLTDIGVAALKRKPAPYFHPDPELPKHGIRIRPAGAGAYTVITRNPFGAQKWVKIGSTAEMKIAEARDVARIVIRRVEQGLEPFEPQKPKPESVEAVIRLWLERHVEKERLRTAKELHRVVEKYILPHWGERAFGSIKRADITTLLDFIEDRNGPGMADNVLRVFRSITTWFRDERDETYVPPPFSKKMRRTPKQNRKRSRVLNDDEIRAVWRAAEHGGPFGRLVQLLLLCCQRRGKVSSMRRPDIAADGTWTIPHDEREKGTPDSLQLSPLALAIIKKMKPLAGNDFVFAGIGDGHRAFSFARDKAAFDDACGVTGWTLHDLRRTSRTLMSRAQVRPDVAELLLGHSVSGLVETYDRHPYTDEMAEALRRLAALIEHILAGPAGGKNVVTFHGVAASS
jgi:integrase